MRVESFVGRRMQEIRDQNGMTQEALGIYLGPLLGKPWSRQTVSAAENGQRAFIAAELLAIAQVLAVSPVRLLTPPVDVEEVEFPSGHKVARDRLNKPEPDEQGKGAVADRIRHALTELSQARIELITADRSIDRNLKSIGDVLDRLASDIQLTVDEGGEVDGGPDQAG